METKNTSFNLDSLGRLIITDRDLLKDISGGNIGGLTHEGVKKLNTSPSADCGCGGGKGNSGCCNGYCK